MKTFEKELPSVYSEAFVVDAKDKKTIIILNIAAFVITFAVIGSAVVFILPNCNIDDCFSIYSVVRNILFLASLIMYMVLHELVHGLAYKLLTGQKLTFGLTLSVAYCGVPDIYVYRTAALIAVLAPFTVFTVLFSAALFLFSDPWDLLYMSVLLGLHIGGCVGDLYDAGLYLFRFKDASTLMRDTGPKQTFYTKQAK